MKKKFLTRNADFKFVTHLASVYRYMVSWYIVNAAREDGNLKLSTIQLNPRYYGCDKRGMAHDHGTVGLEILEKCRRCPTPPKLCNGSYHINGMSE
jgi:hypothetical protein